MKFNERTNILLSKDLQQENIEFNFFLKGNSMRAYIFPSQYVFYIINTHISSYSNQNTNQVRKVGIHHIQVSY